MPRQLVIPPWADDIKVEESDSQLVVTGIGTSFQPIPNEDNIEWDRDLLRGFDAGRRQRRDQSRKVPHFLFAGAHTAEQQLEFVRDYGPVLATKIAYGEECDVLIARQNLEILTSEQKLFSRIFDLIRSLRRLKDWSRLVPEAVREYNRYSLSILEGNLPARQKDLALRMRKDPETFLLKYCGSEVGLREEIGRVRELVISIQELIDSYPEITDWDLEADLSFLPRPFGWKESVSLGSFCRKERLLNDLSINVVMLANMLLCRIFNQVPLALHYAGGVVQELPEAAPYGIRPILYYMLRMEYLYQREIKICARPNCGWYFTPDRSDGQFCSDSCEKRVKARRSRERRKVAGSGTS